jgi:hypothetical protein
MKPGRSSLSSQVIQPAELPISSSAEIPKSIAAASLRYWKPSMPSGV